MCSSDLAKIGISNEHLLPYGHDKAKVSEAFIKSLSNEKDGHLILVTAINPTPAGEGKTTTTVGLGDGLNAIGKKAAVCIREASLGPCFGMKGGAAGGGYAQVVPMEEMNLHFTGDFHAITSAHNLLAAMLDNHVYWGNELEIDIRRVAYQRVIDMNDRALRQVVCNLGGVANGFPRQSGFDITVASEIMAIFCLANDLKDLEARIGNIIVAETRGRDPITATDLKGAGPMTVLLKEAILPNLVQTLEHTPAFVHGGPFANIAHGCNSVIATKAALKLADYVVTEAGFGADLGAEKFFDIKCRKAGLKPDAVVLVATARALKMHGGVAKADLSAENVGALVDGLENLGRHLRNIGQFGVPTVVAINKFTADTSAEIDRYGTTAGNLVSRCLNAITGPMAALVPRDWPSMLPTLPTRGVHSFVHFTRITCPYGKRLAPWPATFTVLMTSSQTKRFEVNLTSLRRNTVISRSVWPKHNTVFRQIQIYSALRVATWSPLESCACLPGPNL